MSDISIIIPIYNKGASITEALASIAAQEHVRPEIIVVDDASEDDSAGQARAWGMQNPGIPFRLVRQPRRQFALAARLAGLDLASAPEIMFMDADDRLRGRRRLARVLAAKRQTGCQLAHCRSQELSPSGISLGEYKWDAPLVTGVLRGREILQAYTARPYPPGEIWGRIYSRELLDAVCPYLREIVIYRLDTILSVAAMFCAGSYLGCDEYLYEYRQSDAWPMAKYAGRLHDLKIYRDVLRRICADRNVPPQYGEAFIAGFINRFYANNAGKLCIEIEKSLSAGGEPDEIFAELGGILDDDALVGAALFSNLANISKIMACLQRIRSGF